MNKEKQKVINLLKRNGFEKVDTNHYINGYFSFNLSEDYISIALSDGYELFCKLDYFSTLGMLYFLDKTHTGELRVKI